MELCYIWVSRFRNINGQGFSFSSRFLVNYNQSDNALDISDKPSYIAGFFGPSVTNVTGIVGVNAAGKTNLLDLIGYLMDGGNTKLAEPFLLVFHSEGQFTVQLYNLEEPHSNRTIQCIKYTGSQKNLETIYFSNTFDGRRHEFGKNIHDLSTNSLLYGNFRENIQTNLKKEVQQQVRFLQSHLYQTMEVGELDIKPAFVQFISPIWENIYSRAKTFDRLITESLSDAYAGLFSFCRHFRKEITRRKQDRPFVYYTAFLVLMDFLCNEIMLEVNGKKRAPEAKVLQKELKELSLHELIAAPIPEIYRAITGRIAQWIDKTYPHTFEKFKFLHELDGYHFEAVEWQTEGTYSNRKYEFRSELTADAERFIRNYSEATTQLTLNYTIEWPGISAGQKAFLTLFSRLYSIAGALKTNHLLITIDEGDLYFHPRWQVEFLSRLLNILPLIFPDKKIQLILTTHSPFLVSDLTKSHLLFLRKSGENCEVIPSAEIIKETFGGNIGELYLDAFFLDGNLISHFAAGKIRGMLEKLKNKDQQFSTQDRLLLEQLGDKFIRYQLKKLQDDTN